MHQFGVRHIRRFQRNDLILEIDIRTSRPEREAISTRIVKLTQLAYCAKERRMWLIGTLQAAPGAWNTREMKLIQVNLNYCQAASDSFSQTIREKDIDATILSEPLG